MLTASLTVARRIAYTLGAGTAAVALAFGGTSTASAAAMSSSVKMTLPRSIAPSPRFQLPGICGYTGASNTATCASTVIKAIDAARKVEPLNGIPPRFNLTAFDKLSPAEQIFAIADIERTARGETPIAGLTLQLNAIAEAGAVHQGDPTAALPLQLSGGGISTMYGSNWAEGTSNPLGADYYWMYDDGPNSPNLDCRAAGDPGCWGHRENVLGNYTNKAYCPYGSPVTAVMGAAEVTSHVMMSPSIAEIFVNDCGRAPTMYFTWDNVQDLVFGN
jgi:hypothetical protein